MRLRIAYDPEAGCAYVMMGAPRKVRRTVELDDDVWADYDDDNQVIGIEFLGVSTPELTIYEPGEFVTRPPREDVRVKGDLL